MIRRIINKFRFLSLMSKVESFDKLRKLSPFDKLEIRAIKQNKEMLRPYYEQYIREVSRADMAASLELAAFLFTICKLNRYTKVLDVGSGLSSFVFRLYAMENPGVNVFSVDDDATWLEKTKDFLHRHLLSTENILTLEEFLKLKETNFDCILHDLNFVEVRINYVDSIMKILKQEGIVIFDDVHKPDYLFALLTKMRKAKVKTYSLKPITIDSYGRFSLAVLKIGS